MFRSEEDEAEVGEDYDAAMHDDEDVNLDELDENERAEFNVSWIGIPKFYLMWVEAYGFHFYDTCTDFIVSEMLRQFWKDVICESSILFFWYSLCKYAP